MATLCTPILVDGSYGEGGGALLRASLVMSALTMQPFRITNVRGATNHPGLDVEDLILLRALAAACAAEHVGAELGSSAVSFLPTRKARGLAAFGRAKGPPDLLLVRPHPRSSTILSHGFRTENPAQSCPGLRSRY